MTKKLSSPNKRDATFTLIKAMSRSEKRTFSIMTNAYGNDDADYVRIFNYMNKQEEYHENAAKHYFRKESFVVFYAARKKYLYYKIMESLRRHYDEKMDEMGFYTHLKNTQILRHKGLYPLMGKEVKKMQTIVDKYELQEEKLIAIRYVQLLALSDYSDIGWKRQQTLYGAYLKAMMQLEKVVTYRNHLSCIRHDYFTDSHNYFNQLKHLRDNAYELIKSPDLNFQSKRYLAEIKVEEAIIQGQNKEEVLSILISSVELLRQHPDMISNNTSFFFTSFINLIHTAIRYKMLKLCKKYATIFEELVVQSKINKHSSQLIHYNLWRTRYQIKWNILEFEKKHVEIWQLGKRFRQEIGKHKMHISKTDLIISLFNYLNSGIRIEAYEDVIILAKDLLNNYEIEKLGLKYYSIIISTMLIAMYESSYKILSANINEYRKKMQQYGVFDVGAQFVVALLNKLLSKKAIGNEQAIFQYYYNKRLEHLPPTPNNQFDFYVIVWRWLEEKNKANPSKIHSRQSKLRVG
ncbi:MAG: hypothetical protein ACPGRW_09080 [Flavobacteriaceae bacterium]